MPAISFIDSASLIHAMNVGLGPGWAPGQAIPSNATRYLEELFSGSERRVINELILREIANGSHIDDGQLENWVRAENREQKTGTQKTGTVY